jgi:hypothetical protein
MSNRSDSTPETTPREAAPGLEQVQRKLDAVLARIRLLRVTAGLARLAWQLLLALVVLYALDRSLALPLGVRAALLLLLAVLLAREVWRRVARPLLRGPDRLDAARLVERERPQFEGRIVSALQLRGGPVGSLERRVVAEAAAACEGLDLRQVLVARPSLNEVWRALAALVVVAGLVLLAHPQLRVFASRWTLHATRWPRDVRLQLRLPPRGPSHVLGEDGTLVAARGGVLEADALAEGKDPVRVELVAEGARGERVAAMSALPESGAAASHLADGQPSDSEWRGRITVQAGDVALFVRGGDDDGADSRLSLTVIEPPRLDSPRFTLEPPAYLGQASSEVGPEGLSVAEGTRITLHGTPLGEAASGELRLAASSQVLPLIFDGAQPPGVSAAFLANEPDTLVVSLTGAWGLQTPDPGHMALMVLKDRPPTLRVFAPSRSDVKVTARAVVPFAVIAEDDHGVAAVTLQAGESAPIPLVADATRPAHRRTVLDLSATPITGSLSYVLRAEDSRDLPGRGPQAALAEGRRLDVVDDAEVQRLLADRQLRLKEAFQSIRERQQTAAESVGALADAPPAADDPDLLASVVAQNQVTSRLALQARELCGILDETLTNRLDPGPGAGAVLTRRLADWSAAPADEVFSPVSWRALASDYAAGKFGRLDQVGRLLDMSAVALQLSEQDSPEAHRLLGEARAHPAQQTLAAAQKAQLAVVSGLDQLLQRMDEWEDYQEVLVLVKTLIDDQHGLRTRTQQVLSGSGPN